jgi:hypothetical protein
MRSSSAAPSKRTSGDWKDGFLMAKPTAAPPSGCCRTTRVLAQCSPHIYLLLMYAKPDRETVSFAEIERLLADIAS